MKLRLSVCCQRPWLMERFAGLNPDEFSMTLPSAKNVFNATNGVRRGTPVVQFKYSGVRLPVADDVDRRAGRRLNGHVGQCGYAT